MERVDHLVQLALPAGKLLRVLGAHLRGHLRLVVRLGRLLLHFIDLCAFLCDFPVQLLDLVGNVDLVLESGEEKIRDGTVLLTKLKTHKLKMIFTPSYKTDLRLTLDES